MSCVTTHRTQVLWRQRQYSSHPRQIRIVNTSSNARMAETDVKKWASIDLLLARCLQRFTLSRRTWPRHYTYYGWYLFDCKLLLASVIPSWLSANAVQQIAVCNTALIERCNVAGETGTLLHFRSRLSYIGWAPPSTLEPPASPRKHSRTTRTK